MCLLDIILIVFFPLLATGNIAEFRGRCSTFVMQLIREFIFIHFKRFQETLFAIFGELMLSLLVFFDYRIYTKFVGLCHSLVL